MNTPQGRTPICPLIPIKNNKTCILTYMAVTLVTLNGQSRHLCDNILKETVMREDKEAMGNFS